MAVAACVTMGTMGFCNRTSIPTASFSLLSGSRKRVSLTSVGATRCCSPLLHSSFVTASSLSLSSRSSFSGLSLGVDMNFRSEEKVERSYRLVVRAKKFLLCQTKRNRSRKSLARTHGFKVRMSTTSGRAVLKRRRAKGRWILCTKTNHNSGKRP